METLMNTKTKKMISFCLVAMMLISIAMVPVHAEEFGAVIDEGSGSTLGNAEPAEPSGPSGGYGEPEESGDPAESVEPDD